MKTLALMLAAGVAIAPIAAIAQPTPMYVRDAGASDMFEKASADAVLSTTRNPDIRRFAQMMIRDHTNSTNMVKMAARRDHVMVGTPHLNAEQSRMLAELRRTPGRDRDAVYIRQQIMAHQAALQVQQDYSTTGDKPALRNAAGQIVPVVQQHISILQGMGDGHGMANHHM